VGGPEGLEVEVEAGQVGFDAGRLHRIDRHFACNVEDGRLPGWLVLVSRRGRIVHLATCGRRDLEADLPVQTATRFRIFWVDPAEQLTAIFLTQLMPSSTYPLRSELRQLVYQALVD
jgi:CubicO group peptidase (beta-lactamase class C family)